MTRLPEMWEAIQRNLPRGKWLQLQEIYETVKKSLPLDDDDYLPQSPSSDLPKWKRNVRSVLQYRKKTGEIEWGRDAMYRL